VLAGTLEHVDGMDRHGRGRRRSVAPGRDQPEIAEAHVLHRARNGADVAGVLRANEDYADALEAHGSPDTASTGDGSQAAESRIDSVRRLS
jgi:hypothetical protein